jgi:hypothetical protein
MYTTLTREGSGCTDQKTPQGHVRVCRVSSVFEENNNLITGTEINLSAVLNKDMSDDRRRTILQRCF